MQLRCCSRSCWRRVGSAASIACEDPHRPYLPSSSTSLVLLLRERFSDGMNRQVTLGRPWTPEEDEKLINAVHVHGDNTEKWKTIASAVPGRTNKACRKVSFVYLWQQAAKAHKLLCSVGFTLSARP